MFIEVRNGFCWFPNARFPGASEDLRDDAIEDVDQSCEGANAMERDGITNASRDFLNEAFGSELGEVIGSSGVAVVFRRSFEPGPDLVGELASRKTIGVSAEFNH